LVRRYRRKFGLQSGCPLDETKVMGHWTLERRLAEELRLSTSGNRWDVFERCYTTLYRECPWLNDGVAPADGDALDFAHIARLLGPARTVYEVGSGKARLLRYLASLGFECVATEVTQERGAKWQPAIANLTWRNCDGVNLTRFEARDSFDAVVSSHVVEHLHPDDLATHLENVRAILKPGGRYVLSTPHRYAGPADLSEVFQLSEAVCMHLKEYTWGELAGALTAAGFARVEGAYVLPRPMRRWLPVSSFHGTGTLTWARFVEDGLALLPPALRRPAAKAAKMALFRPEIMLVAYK
jgi:SAM-dependent methyltransferase